MNRINIITLGVRDIAESLRFYRDGLGFHTTVKEDGPAIVFFNNTGTKLALYPLEELAKDINEKEPPKKNGFPGLTLAYNAKSIEEVNDVINKAEKAGGTIEKSPHFFGEGTADIFQTPMVTIGRLRIPRIGILMKMIC